MGYERTFVEKEATCPGGGRMRWSVSVEEPSEGSLCAFIVVEEGSTEHHGKDVLMLDVDAAAWLLKTLSEALEVARDVERKAALLETVRAVKATAD